MVESVCAVLREQGCQVAARTYRAWRSAPPPAARVVSDALVINVLKATVGQPESLYGRRKMVAHLRRQGLTVAHCTVDRLMADLGMKGVVRAKSQRTTVPGKDSRRAGDLVDRDFTAAAPNRLFVADFTYVRTWAGFVYVAFVVDAFSRRIVGWRAARSMTTALVLDALEHALFTRAREGVTDLAGLISHSDAGSQYTSVALTQRLLEEGIDPSVGSVGDALDNAMAETTVGSFKNELIRRQGPWRDVDHVEIGTAGWVAWFNTERPHNQLDDFTPEAVEKLHYAHKNALTTQSVPRGWRSTPRRRSGKYSGWP